jgi:hypothetical protein
VLAADISPIDVLSHIPVLCEEVSVPYLFVSGKAELGAAAGTKRPTSVVLVTTKTAKGESGAAVAGCSCRSCGGGAGGIAGGCARHQPPTYTSLLAPLALPRSRSPRAGDKPAFDAADKLAEVMEEAKALAPKA